jgi:Uma2 family endonuclease
MPPTTGAYTRADYDRLPEGFPAQLVNGWLVKEPAPTYGHQTIAVRLAQALSRLVADGLLVLAPCDVVIDERNVFQPDVVVLRKRAFWDRSNVGIPRLAIEILSPTSARRDRARKTPRLLAAGVDEVWLVDPATETIEVVDRDGSRTAAGDQRLASRAIAGFAVVPRELFARPA